MCVKLFLYEHGKNKSTVKMNPQRIDNYSNFKFHSYRQAFKSNKIKFRIIQRNICSFSFCLFYMKPNVENSRCH